MGGGSAPGPRADLRDPSAIDDGTLPRIGSPTPGAIGLGGKGSGSKPTAAAIAGAVVSYATANVGQKVGDGECFALADRALRNAGAKSAADYGPIVPDGDYVWGKEVSLANVKAGDIVQFRDYSCTVETVTETDKDETTKERVEERPHHTAIVERVGRDGAVTVLEQNYPPGSAVVRTQLYFADRESQSGGRKTTVTVHGRVWFYTPQAR
jgi:hypothetical protein